MVEQFLQFPIKPYNLNIPKKEIIEHSTTASVKRILKKVQRINLLYLLNSKNSGIPPFVNDNYNYSQIMVIELYLTSNKSLAKISTFFQQLFPSPLLLFPIWDDELAISVAWKRRKSPNSELVVVEKSYLYQFSNPAFLERLNYHYSPKTNMLDFYRYYIQLVVSAQLALRGIESGEEEVLEQVQNIEKEINSLRKKLKKEINFNKKMELHIRIQQLKQQLKELKTIKGGGCENREIGKG